MARVTCEMFFTLRIRRLISRKVAKARLPLPQGPQNETVALKSLMAPARSSSISLLRAF